MVPARSLRFCVKSRDLPWKVHPPSWPPPHPGLGLVGPLHEVVNLETWNSNHTEVKWGPVINKATNCEKNTKLIVPVRGREKL